MPSARYFRLAVADVNKDNLHVSAIHLFNDNTRVDNNATLSSGYGETQQNLTITKNEVPVVDSKLEIPVSAKRRTSLYIVWTFATAVNVNSFKIGSGADASTFLDKFVLQWSDNGIDFTPFITITADKKLSYPGPWQLTDLKPVGECYPALMSVTDQTFQVTNAGGYIGLKDNFSFQGNENYKGAFMLNAPSSSTSQYSIPVPGIYQTGKYYFEVTLDYKNLYLNTLNHGKLLFAMVNDAAEKLQDARTDTTLRGTCISINHPMASPTTAASPWAWSYTGTPMSTDLAFVSFKAGVQCGYAIDFDNRTIKIVNPSWNNKPAGIYDFTNINFTANGSAGMKYKTFIMLASGGTLNAFSEAPKFNFGQRAFTHTPPTGYQPGYGPRWKEEPAIVTPVIYLPEYINKETGFDVVAAGDRYGSVLTLNRGIPMRANNENGNCYIKGNITRQPNVDIKRFVAHLFSHDEKRVIATCVASSTGVYEFYGLPRRPYTVLSVDVRDGSVSEAIGPVYPTEIT